jgi:para-aminobenzoate synthetase/4-amino-4-deoxychorismate lyase
MSAPLPDHPDPTAGVYETVRVRDGAVQALDAHLARLAASLGEHRIRVNAVPHAGAVRFDLVSSPVTTAARRPVSLAPVVVPGGLGPHKWNDRRLIESHGADPVPLLVDTDDAVLEAAWGNIWILDGNELITPPTDGRILPGVTRATLLAIAPRLGLTPREAPIALAEVRAADTVLITSSLRLAVAAAIGPPPPERPEIAVIRDALAIF